MYKKKLFIIALFVVSIPHFLFAQVCGCTDVKANNYNASADCNDGSCVYDSVSITPSASKNLPDQFKETSGLINWNGKLWTHNDDTDKNLYAFDPLTPSSYSSYTFNGITNIEWEEISQDETYVYLGDFGNNTHGNRTNLRIWRVSKNSILSNSPVADTINFSYEKQTDFTPQSNNSTDFDCEAFVVADDSIYLFTKEWNSNQTSLYALPKTPGTYIAKFKDIYNVEGLVTGATYLKDKKLAVLTGYSESLAPFVVLLYDFENGDFFGANKRKITLNNAFTQVEGISTTDGLIYFITNEFFSYSFITVTAKIQTLNLTEFLDVYLYESTDKKQVTMKPKLYPNPVRDVLKIEIPDNKQMIDISIFNTLGEKIGMYKLNNGLLNISIDKFDNGVYYYSAIDDAKQNILKGKFIVKN